MLDVLRERDRRSGLENDHRQTTQKKQNLICFTFRVGNCNGYPAGLCAVTKVLIAMEEGTLPANLHYKTPNTEIPALVDGRLTVVAENTRWQGGYVGINSFGFGGSNVHVLLKSHKGAKTGQNAVRPQSHQL